MDDRRRATPGIVNHDEVLGALVPGCMTRGSELLTMAHERIGYEERIIVDPEILVGKPVVRGTRIPVELVLKRLAQDLDIEALLHAYPRLTPDDVKACLAYAQAIVEGEEVYLAQPSAAR